MAFGDINHRARQSATPRQFVVGVVFLAVVLWQFLAPLLANTPCGLIIPHEHVLIGQANEDDLDNHLAAEAACAAGKPSSPEKQSADLHGRKGVVLNVVRLDRNTITRVFDLDGLAAWLPTPVMVPALNGLRARLDSLHLLGQSVAIPPPKLPPVSA
jgi:hypothetical protein